MTRRAVAYIRRSSGKESPLSLSAQTEAVNASAEARGETIASTFRDHGYSGGDRTRPEFLAMLAAIEAGHVSAVYAYDADRLARREATLHMLLDACEEAGASVIDRTGRDLAGRDRMTAGVLAVVDSQMLRDITERNRENARNRRARHDDDGPPPYGYRRQRIDTEGTMLRPLRSGERAAEGERFVFMVDDAEAIARVVDTYRETRSLNGTARSLNAAGVKADRGGTWHAASVVRVIDRNAPELRQGAKGRGVRAGAKPRLLLRLLRCHCGQVMSPADARAGVRWYCRQAVVGVHGGPRGISQNRLLPWVREEAGRLAVPYDVAESDGPEYDDSDDRARLEAARDLIGEPAYLEAVERLRAAHDAHGERQAIRQAIPPAIEWQQWTTEAINGALRAMWDHVELGPDLLPIEAEWRVPEWRA